VYYETITPESAARGEIADWGFLDRNGWNAGNTDSNAGGMSLRDAVALVTRVEDCGRGFTEIDVRTYRTANAQERRTLLPPRRITVSSYRRLSRLLCS
jgi:hypothetical protein